MRSVIQSGWNIKRLRTASAFMAMTLLLVVGKLGAQEPYLLKDMVPGAGDSSFDQPGGIGRILYFGGGNSNNIELWTSNGTEAGTFRIKDLWGEGGSNPSRFTRAGDAVYLRARSTGSSSALWKTDGTEGGTVQFWEHPTNDPQGISDIASIGEGILFVHTINFGGNRLWKSDGTDEGTVEIKINGTDPIQSVSELTEFGGVVLFSGNSGGIAGLWRTDGTDEGTVNLIDLQAFSLTRVGDLLFFVGVVDGQDELWKSDGTVEGTEFVADTNPQGISFLENLTAVGNRLFFTSIDNLGDRELYVSDGTELGTVRVKDIRTNGSSDPDKLTAAGGLLFFTATDNNADEELWRSDGTEGGTVRAKDIRTNGSSNPDDLAAIGTLAFFGATDTDGDTELWRSDGTEDGTWRHRDLNPSGSSNPSGLFSAAGRLYFRADEGTGYGRELYALDASMPHVGNLSTRGFVGTGDNVMIAGIIIEDGPKEVIIRAIGPGLDAYGVPNTLGNPTLQIFSGATLIASNDDWRDTQETEIEATGIAPGFDAESAVVLELDEGAYTAIVSGGVGNALVELFELH